MCRRMSRAAREEEVLAYLREEHAPLYQLALWVRAAVRESDPDLFERVYRGWRGVGFHHAEAGYVCAIYPRGDHVDLLFEHGASLVDPDGVLAGQGTQTRTLPVATADARTAAAIESLVQQAIAQRLLRYT
jgi:hypothetical protein